MPIEVSVIELAVSGDSEALVKVVNHYRAFICALSVRAFFDQYGNEILYVDDAIVQRLEAKLISSIVTKFKISVD